MLLQELLQLTEDELPTDKKRSERGFERNMANNDRLKNDPKYRKKMAKMKDDDVDDSDDDYSDADMDAADRARDRA